MFFIVHSSYFSPITKIMIHRNNQGQLVEVVRTSFKNDKLYHNHLYSLLSPSYVPSVSLAPPSASVLTPAMQLGKH